MRKAVCVVVYNHLGVSGGAGCEVQQVQFVGAGGNALHGIGVVLDLFIKVAPALVGAVDDRLYAQVSVPEELVGFVDVAGNVSVRSRDYRGNVRSLKAVLKILGGEHVGRGNCDRAYLHQTEDSVPVLVVPLEDEHDLVALFYAPAAEHVRSLCGEP